MKPVRRSASIMDDVVSKLLKLVADRMTNQLNIDLRLKSVGIQITGATDGVATLIADVAKRLEQSHEISFDLNSRGVQPRQVDFQALQARHLFDLPDFLSEVHEAVIIEVQ